MARWLAALSLVLVVAAYKDTVPVVVWSSHLNHDLDALSASTNSYSSSADLFHRLLQVDGICNFGAVVFIDEPGLSTADLTTSPYLAKQLSNAPSSLQIPYLPSSASESKEFETFKEAISKKCDVERKEISLGSRSRSEMDGLNQVVGISMPPLDTSNGIERRQQFVESERQLEKVIEEQTSSVPSYFVIYTSSLSARMEIGLDTAENSNAFITPIDTAEVTINSTLPTGSLLQRYRFFTPGLLIGFLVGFVILLPVLLFGIYALASIQTPSRMDTVGTRTVSLNKKNQ